MAQSTRNTKQKQLIKKILCSTTTHPTADWIYEQARKEIPNISLGTVYRNLNQLKEGGQILELNYGGSYSRYDGNPQPHYHFRCISCSNVLDVDLEVQTELNVKLAQQGYQVKGHRLEFFGICPKCLKE